MITVTNTKTLLVHISITFTQFSHNFIIVINHELSHLYSQIGVDDIENLYCDVQRKILQY